MASGGAGNDGECFAARGRCQAASTSTHATIAQRPLTSSRAGRHRRSHGHASSPSAPHTTALLAPLNAHCSEVVARELTRGPARPSLLHAHLEATHAIPAPAGRAAAVALRRAAPRQLPSASGAATASGFPSAATAHGQASAPRVCSEEDAGAREDMAGGGRAEMRRGEARAVLAAGRPVAEAMRPQPDGGLHVSAVAPTRPPNSVCLQGRQLLGCNSGSELALGLFPQQRRGSGRRHFPASLGWPDQAPQTGSQPALWSLYGGAHAAGAEADKGWNTLPAIERRTSTRPHRDSHARRLPCAWSTVLGKQQ